MIRRTGQWGRVAMGVGLLLCLCIGPLAKAVNNPGDPRIQDVKEKEVTKAKEGIDYEEEELEKKSAAEVEPIAGEKIKITSIILQPPAANWAFKTFPDDASNFVEVVVGLGQSSGIITQDAQNLQFWGTAPTDTADLWPVKAEGNLQPGGGGGGGGDTQWHWSAKVNQVACVLFLDDDNDWDQDHQDDIGNYVPKGYDVSGENPQVVKLIAQVAPAEAAGLTATFSLSDTTSYPGYCMNKGTSTEADFSLPSTTTVAFAADGTARIDLTSRDYAGYTRVGLVIKREGKVVGGTTKTVPKDDNGNHIADSGWDATDGNNTEHVNDPGAGHEGDDTDSNPAGDGHHGDFLTAFEEYRGLFVRDHHRRTSPARKDVFVYSEVPADGTNPTMGDAANLTTWNHRIYQSEMNANKTINFNTAAGMPGHGQHNDRWAVRVTDEGYSTAYYGYAFPLDPANTAPGLYPNLIDRCAVYIQTIRENSNPTHDRTTVDSAIDTPFIRHVLGHEIGHAHGMSHYRIGEEGVANIAQASPMVTGVLPQAGIPQNYITRDTIQIRVRQ